MLLTARKTVWPALVLAWVVTLCAAGCFPRLAAANAHAESRPAAASTADHTKFEQLKVQFNSGPEVTRACLSCHTEAARQIHKTMHWTWAPTADAPSVGLGKRHVINNY